MTARGPVASWWEREGEDIRCLLCPRKCLVAPGTRGYCGARVHVPGEGLVAGTYGSVSSLAVDPVEKKPLYHWNPGTRTLSLGSTGCSMDCPFCQNWSIAKPESSGKVPVHAVAPEALAPLARKAGVPSVSFTYNEPLVSFEYLRDAARLLREEGLASILVSNGMIEEAPLGEILPLLSAANIDLKAFTERGYALLGGFLGTVRRTIDRLLSSGVHVEVTFLLVPGINDEPAPFLQMVQWLSGLDPQPVLHISRYFPNRLWDRAPLSSTTMAEYVERASSVLEYVYEGNSGNENLTVCRDCQGILVRRSGFRVLENNLDPGGCCLRCGTPSPIVMNL